MRLNAVIAFKWLLDDEKLVAIVVVEGHNRSVSRKLWVTEYIQEWSLILVSMSPTKRPAAPTSKKLCVWMSWDRITPQLHGKENLVRLEFQLLSKHT